MRGALNLARLAVADCWAFGAAAIGLALLLAQIFVLRKRYIYVGFLGVGLLLTALRRFSGATGGADAAMLCAQVLALGYAVVFMVKHSFDNLAEVRAQRAQRYERFLRDIEKIAGGAPESVAPHQGTNDGDRET